MAKKSRNITIKHSNKKKAKVKNKKEKFTNSYKPFITKKKFDALPLRERMMEKLKSAKFRYMNEELYSMKGKDALQYFKKNVKAFDDYHRGYQKQVEKWPINPLDVVIEALKKGHPAGSVIADFGCGEARLAESLPNFAVHSFDLVALSPRVTVCDVANTPLTSSSVDVVVCCLSLMGTNMTDYVREANRILKIGGILKIAEVESRFEDIDKFLHSMNAFGFQIVNTNLEYHIFYFMDLKKERNLGKKSKKKLPELVLKPCLYKKR